MKSIKRVFDKVQKENPGWSSYTAFSHAITGKNFSHDRLARMFNELVEKTDYDKSDKKDILAYLYILNKPLKRTRNEGKLASREEEMTEVDTDLPDKDKDGIDDIIPIRTIPPEELLFRGRL